MSQQPPMQGNPPPSIPPPGYPVYPQGPGWASGYPQGAPAYYPPPPPPTLPPVPAQAPDNPNRTRAIRAAIGVTLAVAAALALALAAGAPFVTARDPGHTAMAGATKVYDAPLRDDSANWDIGSGCAFEGGGLHAPNRASGALCAFLPSQQADLTSAGFYLSTTIAPPADVPSEEVACVAFTTQDGDMAVVAFDQSGRFLIAASATSCDVNAPPGVVVVRPDTSAWHANGHVANTLSLRYDAGAGTLIVYANGLEVARESWSLTGQRSISLGTAPDAEAIFTSFSLWAGA